MAHFAKLDENNVVQQVVVVANDIATSESAGVTFLNNLYGTNDVWKQTSYNTIDGTHKLGGTPFRKNYAGINFTYDSSRDAFIPPKYFNSWTLDETKCVYVAPVTYPTIKTYNDENGDEQKYSIYWDEDNLRWLGDKTISDNYYWNPSNLSWISYTP